MNTPIAISLIAISLAFALSAAEQTSSPSMPGLQGMGKMGAMTPAQHETILAMHQMNKNMMAAADADLTEPYRTDSKLRGGLSAVRRTSVSPPRG